MSEGANVRTRFAEGGDRQNHRLGTCGALARVEADARARVLAIELMHGEPVAGRSCVERDLSKLVEERGALGDAREL